MPRTCTAKTQAGTPCRMKPLVGSDPALCVTHGDPEKAATGRAKGSARVAARAERSRTLGTAAGAPPTGKADESDDDPLWFSELYTASEVEGALAWVAMQAITGKLGPRDVAAMTRTLHVLLERIERADPCHRRTSDRDDAIAEAEGE
jgi:hypothetical protein